MDAAEALENHRPFKRDNTEVRQVGKDKSRLYLYGSAIAEMRDDELQITDAGHPTATTKERLNALPDVRIHTQRGQLYLNGKKWSGDWTLIHGRVGTWYDMENKVFSEHIDNPRGSWKDEIVWTWGWPEKIGPLKKEIGEHNFAKYGPYTIEGNRIRGVIE